MKRRSNMQDVALVWFRHERFPVIDWREDTRKSAVMHMHALNFGNAPYQFW
jgi:hypothetical protein